MLRSLHIITNEERHKTFSAMNPVATENAGEKHDTARGKLYHAITNRHLAYIVSEKNWNTKEDKGRSMRSALYILQLAKRHVSE